jgi:Uma2 family endonuclease
MPDEGPPDIALEVVLTNPLLDKLAVYAGLGVREVWAWSEGAFRVFALRGAGAEAVYEELAASELVPQLELAPLADYAEREDQHAAVREYRDRLRGR